MNKELQGKYPTGRTQGEGRWEKIEDYIYRKTDQKFTHGICPECTEKVFGEGATKKKKDIQCRVKC